MFTTEGINKTLDVAYDGAAQPTWYVGLIDDSGFTVISSADTAASHAGWTENQDYTAGTRPAWGPDAASGGSITNGTLVDFAMNATADIRGYFVISDNVKGGTSGTILLAKQFDEGVQSVTSGDTIRVTVTVDLG